MPDTSANMAIIVGMKKRMSLRRYVSEYIILSCGDIAGVLNLLKLGGWENQRDRRFEQATYTSEVTHNRNWK